MFQGAVGSGNTHGNASLFKPRSEKNHTVIAQTDIETDRIINKPQSWSTSGNTADSDVKNSGRRNNDAKRQKSNSLGHADGSPRLEIIPEKNHKENNSNSTPTPTQWLTGFFKG